MIDIVTKYERIVKSLILDHRHALQRCEELFFDYGVVS